MNSDYFVTKIFIPLEQANFPWGRASHQKRLIVSLDNDSVHARRPLTDWVEEYRTLCMRSSRRKVHAPAPRPEVESLPPMAVYLDSVQALES
jgi:hypothetical protein